MEATNTRKVGPFLAFWRASLALEWVCVRGETSPRLRDNRRPLRRAGFFLVDAPCPVLRDSVVASFCGMYSDPWRLIDSSGCVVSLRVYEVAPLRELYRHAR